MSWVAKLTLLLEGFLLSPLQVLNSFKFQLNFHLTYYLGFRNKNCLHAPTKIEVKIFTPKKKKKKESLPPLHCLVAQTFEKIRNKKYFSSILISFFIYKIVSSRWRRFNGKKLPFEEKLEKKN
jgi:hypothetical protein